MAHLSIYSLRENHKFKYALGHVAGVGEIPVYNVDQLTDGIGNSHLERHLSTIKEFLSLLSETEVPNQGVFVNMCDDLLRLTKHVYDTRYRGEEWVLQQDLLTLKTKCQEMAKALRQ
jgi:hypothetical protein